MATATSKPRAARGQPAGLPPPQEGAPDIRQIARELAAVADYVTHIRTEISALRANELYRDRIPGAHEELGEVRKVTAGAADVIMSTAEEILSLRELPAQAYRAEVEKRLLAIFEACSFQDITGQRIAKVADDLKQLEKSLSRFAAAVKVRDVEQPPDPEEALRKARREILLINGPQSEDRAISQADIDALFD